MIHPYTIHMDGKMTDNVRQLRERGGETEKVTINLGYVDLGRIDLLVQEGFYSNRTDLIRTAIRNQIAGHAEAVSRSIARQTLELGLRDYARADLEAVRARGEVLDIAVIGLVRIASDVDAELGAGHHRLDQRPRRAAGQRRGEGGAGRPHPQPLRERSCDE